jgi:hypothetical protein
METMMEVLVDDTLLSSLKGSQVDINIHVTTTMNITPFVARQKVNVALLDRVGTGLLAGEPVLMAAEDQLRWRVPVNLALPGRGRLDQVGTVDVNAQTGEVLMTPGIAEEIAHHASQLAAGSTQWQANNDSEPGENQSGHPVPDKPADAPA